jgi:hypothetical protein
VALETGVSVATQPQAIPHPTSFSKPNTGPGRGIISLDGRTRLAVVFAPNHTPWMLAAWLCRRKHASAPVGPLPQSRSKRRRTFTTPTESGGNHTSEPPGAAATTDRIPEKIYDFLVGYGAGARD